jgi:hypothetical protein
MPTKKSSWRRSKSLRQGKLNKWLVVGGRGGSLAKNGTVRMQLDKKATTNLCLPCSEVPFPDLVELRIHISYWISCHHSDPNIDLLTCPFRCGRNDFSSLEEVIQHLSEEPTHCVFDHHGIFQDVKHQMECVHSCGL